MPDVKEYLRLEFEEILRHKWIQSEKAGRDLGEEAAFDWVNKYAAKFNSLYFSKNKAAHSHN